MHSAGPLWSAHPAAAAPAARVQPQEAAYDARGAAAARAANEMCKLSTVARNHGIPGLLRQDL